MALPRYTLKYNDRKDLWSLTKDVSGRTLKNFETKQEATTRGVLKATVGQQGGSIKIQKRNGKYEEERTFPRKEDPVRTPG